MLYELPSFEYADARTVEEAVAWIHGSGNRARVIAGGTDLLCQMKDQIKGPELRIPEILVNIKKIHEMGRITYNEEIGLRIGAAVSLSDLETFDIVNQRFSVLSQAASQVGTAQIRNMGTIGGNLCQRARCIYFRHPNFFCFKKGGSTCHAIKGEHRYYHAIMKRGVCAAAHPSDMALALIALNAKAIIVSHNQEKQILLEDFFLAPDCLTENVLKPDELLKEIHVPDQRGRNYQLFLKQGLRHASGFSVASVAAVAHISGEILEGMRIVLGGIAPFPYLVSQAEEMARGKGLNEGLISQAAEASVEGSHPLAQNSYKVNLTKVLVRRVLTSIWRQAVPERN
jgi:xanthine dehydrogenase YagS FAD-binding subunit